MENKIFIDKETDLIKSITDRDYKDALSILQENGWGLKDYRVYDKPSWKHKDVVFPYICFLFCKEDRGIFVEITRHNSEDNYCAAATVLSSDQKLDQEKIESVFATYVKDELHIE